jgi:hypothetical protein
VTITQSLGSKGHPAITFVLMGVKRLQVVKAFVAAAALFKLDVSHVVGGKQLLSMTHVAF